MNSQKIGRFLPKILPPLKGCHAKTNQNLTLRGETSVDNHISQHTTKS